MYNVQFTMYKYLSLLTLFLFFVQTAAAQRLIRRSSQHFVTEQTLPDRVEPLLTDVWDQYTPYNNLCPLDSAGQRCVVGCVATAMSQVMHYWEWPMRGTGSHTYVDSLGTGLTLTADFASHTYDWAQMLDRYEEGQYTQAQADAVALLSLDCGIAVDMRYGVETSGAQSIRQPMALVNYFGYDPGLQFCFRDFYSLAEITLMLKQELAAGRPVLISGYNINGGHAYVLDGYDERDWFHICLGNPAKDGDNWTYLPNMVPDQPTWYDHDSPESGMNFLQMFTLGIMPTYHGEAAGIERHNFALQSISAVVDSLQPDPKPIYERGKVALTVHDLCNIGWSLHSDSVALMLRQGDDIVTPLHTYSHEFLLEEVDDTTYTDTLLLTIPAHVADGAYTIVPMYRDNDKQGGKEWREARTCTGTPNYLIARVEGDEVTLQSDTASTAYLTLEDIDIPDHIVNGSVPDFSVTFRNHNTEMAGRFYLVMEPLDEDGKAFYLHRQGLTLMKDEVSTRRFHKTSIYAPRLGDYRLRIMYESNLFADKLIELPLPEQRIITILSSYDIQIAGR